MQLEMQYPLAVIQIHLPQSPGVLQRRILEYRQFLKQNAETESIRK